MVKTSHKVVGCLKNASYLYVVKMIKQKQKEKKRWKINLEE